MPLRANAPQKLGILLVVSALLRFVNFLKVNILQKPSAPPRVSVLPRANILSKTVVLPR
ncbi:MAG: hypothetical protein FWD72_02315 [Eggerthellaceae bacterium]|nr:hypothetical protein [Eggerthellaceae bacterium]